MTRNTSIPKPAMPQLDLHPSTRVHNMHEMQLSKSARRIETWSARRYLFGKPFRFCENVR